MSNNNKFNYPHWLRLETWTLEQAAFLLHGLDPAQYQPGSLCTHPLPTTLQPIAETYAILQASQQTMNSENPPAGGLIYPSTATAVAIENEIFPWDLIDAIGEEYAQWWAAKEAELRQMIADIEEHSSIPEPMNHFPEQIKEIQSLATRERRNLLKAIGLLVQMLFIEKNASPRYQRGDKINAFQVAQTIIEKAQSLGMEIDGLKSLDRKITAALALLEEEIAA